MTKAYSYIRFSTKEQLKGDSLRRQTESSEIYLKDHPELTLDTDMNMFDSGFSAYKGKNISHGALGKFLKLAEDGKLAKGSVLLIENIDRLSRLKPMDALRIFDKIIHAGIKIVTLQSGTEYSEESINRIPGQLFMIVGEIQRANQEVERKSFLVGKAWENKRKQAINGDRKMTSKCPDWLELSEDNKEFTINEDAQFSINLIFDKKLEGKGSDKIATEMNQSPYWKPLGRKGKKPSWRKSYVDKLLHNDRRLLGELQFYRLIDDERVPIGEPFMYYPPIIEQDKFDRVQAQIKRNFQLKGFSGGRNGKMNNLFSPIAVCFFCGSPMQFIDKGKPPKGGQYYMCDKEKRGIDGGCISSALIRYDKIEENILTYCKGLDVTDIRPKEEAFVSELARLHDKQQAIEGELLKLEKRLQSFSESIANIVIPSLKRVVEKSAGIDIVKLEKLEKEKKDIIDRIEQINNDGKNTQEQLKNIQELIEKMKNMDDPYRLEIRVNLRNHLRRIIKKIRIRPNSIHMLFYTGASRGIHFNYNEDGSIFIQDALRNTMKK